MASRSAVVASYPREGGLLSGFRNKIINGDFDIWQRGNSLPNTGNTTYTADRWRTFRNGSGANINVFKWDHALNSTVPGNRFRNVMVIEQTALSSDATWSNIEQPIEGVRTLSGKKATLTFYARAPSGPFTLPPPGLQQFFGTGGSPSDVTNILPEDIAGTPLTTSFTKCHYTFNIPSVAGKVLGTNSNDCLIVWFALPMTQLFKMELAHVSLVEGDATAEDDPFSPRHIQQELALCQRYFEIGRDRNYEHGDGNTVLRLSGSYRVSKRSTPTVSYNLSGTGVAYAGATTVIFEESSIEGFVGYISPTNPSGGYGFATMIWSANAEL